MSAKLKSYPVRLDIDYPQKLDRTTTFFRLLLSIPIILVFSFLTMAGTESFSQQTNNDMVMTTGGIVTGLFVATLLMILFRKRYPRWWFDFNLELNRFSMRIAAYVFLLTDKYPSTVDKQSVNLEIVYPDVVKDLNRWLPLVKWFLAIPHYFVLLILTITAIFVTIAAWLAIIFTGRYPQDMFDFVVGVFRWNFRVTAYAFLLTTDQYPPFSLK